MSLTRRKVDLTKFVVKPTLVSTTHFLKKPLTISPNAKRTILHTKLTSPAYHSLVKLKSSRAAAPRQVCFVPSPELVIVGTLTEAHKKFKEIAARLGLKPASKFLLAQGKIEVEICSIVENKVY